ncbi:MAG TPA: LTA synthase family protein [Pseudosphingobacterium sp.]|nr:LTA synthase family protein [Pseudosphingobacterium sp.]
MVKLRKVEVPIFMALVARFALLLGIYSLLRIGFYLFNINSFPNLDTSQLLIILLGGIKFDISALLYLNSLYIVLQSLPLPFRYKSLYQKICKWLFIVTNSLGIVANLIDFAYYKFTLKRTTGTVFEQFAHEQNKLKLFIDFLTGYWYLLIIFILLVLLLNRAYDALVIKRPDKRLRWSYYLIQSFIFLIVAALTVIGMRGGWRHSTRPITLSNAGEFVQSPDQMSIVLNTPFSIMRTLKAVNLKPIHYFDEKTLNELYSPIHQPADTVPFKNLNVVFLIIESLGKEHVGALNKDLAQGTYKGYTPFIDSLVENSFTFTHTYANGRKSIDALPSIISGIPSIREPFVLSTYSSNKTTSIAKLLSEKGYETAFFHGAPNGSMGFSSYTKLAGIQHYFGKTEYNNDADFDGMWGIWDEPFMQFMARTINTLHQPFFSAFFSLSSHHPFKVPEQYKGKFPKGPLEVQEPMGYTDMALRKFFETASKMPWYNNTLFVLCADHATVSFFPEYQTIPGAFSIPILFYYPGGNLKGKTDKSVQQIDIMPTVLNYLHYDKPYFAFGFDAFSKDTNNFVINNNDGTFSLYQGDNLLLNDGQNNTALYNLKADRLTKHNLLNQDTLSQNKMDSLLKAFTQQYNNRMIQDDLTYRPAK